MALQNQLVDELVRSGADPAEARRLAVVADVIAGAQLEIDPVFADRTEELLLGEPEPVVAPVYVLPTAATTMDRARRRTAMLSAAAVLILFAAVGVFFKAGISSDTAHGPEAAPPATIVPPVPPDQDVSPPAPEIVPSETKPTVPGSRTHALRSPAKKPAKTGMRNNTPPPPPPPPEDVKRCTISTQVASGGMSANCAASALADMNG